MELGRQLLVRTGIRFAFIGAMLICNVLFFWNADARVGVPAALETRRPPAQSEAGLVHLRIREVRSYGFSVPSEFRRPAPEAAGRPE